MDGSSSKNLISNAVSFCLLPSELIHDIFLRLSLPDVTRLKSVSKTVTSDISCQYFRQQYNLDCISDTWLFFYTKRSCRDSVLYAFTRNSDRWFKIPVGLLLFPVVPLPDLYFLTASDGIFLFASNDRREVIAVNLVMKTVTKIPASPLGPRDTSSWRRSGLKLIAGPPGSGQFRFLFAEVYENRPVLFEYTSELDMWRSVQAIENEGIIGPSGKERVVLSVVHERYDSVLLAVGERINAPVILRPRLETRAIEGRLSIGFSADNAIDCLHVHGDGYMVIVRSEGVVDGNWGARMRVFRSIEVLGLSADGRSWESVSRVPDTLLDKVRKPYGVMMGCLEQKRGVVKFVLVANNEGLWDLIWFCYDLVSGCWKWVPLPELRIKGLNMAGITLSSGPTL